MYRGTVSVPHHIKIKEKEMATITNQATLTYNGVTVTSNGATGEVLEEVTATKTALRETYGAGDTVTYIINVVNSGPAPLTGVSVTDDLGGYAFGGATVYPLTYSGDVALFTDGVPSAPPTVAAGPPLVISDITIPAGGSVTAVYETAVNQFAPLGTGAAIENTATVDGTGFSPVTATETVTHSEGPDLRISKSIAPQTVRSGGQITYTFALSNYGEAATETDRAVIADEFDPILASLTASLDGAPLTETTDYSYDGATGLFETAAGVVTVPAATYTQNEDGSWTIVPGETVLTVSGNIV